MNEVTLLLAVRGILDNSSSVLNSDLAQDIVTALKKHDLFIHSGEVRTIIEVEMRDCTPDFDAYIVYTDYIPDEEE
jgi:hypothetical protein